MWQDIDKPDKFSNALMLVCRYREFNTESQKDICTYWKAKKECDSKTCTFLVDLLGRN